LIHPAEMELAQAQPRPPRPPSSPRRNAPRGAALPLCLTPAALDAAQGLDQNHRANDRAPDGSPASAPRVPMHPGLLGHPASTDKALDVSYPLGFAPHGC
jgi:hypothetical protein